LRPAAFALLLLGACGPGATAQPCSGLPPGSLVITELMTDPTGSDTGRQWIEIFNPFDAEFWIQGIAVYASKGDGTGLKTHVLRAGSIAGLGYFTLGNVGMGALPSYVDYTYENGLGLLPHSGGVVGLKCSDAVLDEVQYGAAPAPGHALQLDDNVWCDADQPLAGTSDFGTPRAPNTPCRPQLGAQSCLDGATRRALVPPAPGSVFFSEVMADPRAVADAQGEWLELHANSAVDLNGAVLAVGTASHSLDSAQCLHLAAGADALLAHSADPSVNGGLPAVFSTFPQSLANGGGALTLGAGDAGIDAVLYPAALPGVAWQRLDAGFCPATHPLDGGELGTPGAPNTACAPPADPRLCFDRATSVMRDPVAPLPGDLVLSELMIDPAAVPDSSGEYVELAVRSRVDLNGLSFAVDGRSTTLQSSTCLSVLPGAFPLIAGSGDPALNGGLPSVFATLRLELTNSGVHAVAISTDAGVLDTFFYGGDAGARVIPGTSLQRAADGGVCPSVSTYGLGDHGTPALPNEACP
jgi:hypothetical protein